MIEAALRLPRAGFMLDVAFTLPSSGVSAVFGPSGCGKTTLLRCLAGLDHAIGGRVQVQDDVWQDETGVFLPPHQRPVGMVFQESALFDHLDVRGNIEFGWKRIEARARRVSLEQAIAWSGAGPLLARTTQGLSGGERQRVALARALAVSPRLLLMDEPLAALDVAGKSAILPALESLAAESGLPIVYVSHSAAEVARLADHLMLMAAGRIVAVGPVGELTARLDLPLPPGEDAGVVLDARVGARDAEWDLMRLDAPGASFWTRDTRLPVGARARLRVLARDVSLALAPAADSSILNQVPVVVEALGDDRQHPSQMLVRVRARVGATDAAEAPAAMPGPGSSQVPLPAVVTPPIPVLTEPAAGCAMLARVTRRSAHALGLAPGRAAWAMVKSVALFE
ncbi:MAG TPA: molybdenum ABC transporter ATP-binding protein [Burkholderiaceae bacterium]|jgi:molybdate transport system ATP-binding protein|nr:molybdenum ABC transporter ATP-binding protein [Burkholderiaceae bacterium]